MIYTVRTTVGQERILADLLAVKQRKDNLQVYSIFVIDEMRGYLFVEAPNEVEVKKLVYGMPHIKGLVKKPVEFEEMKHFFEEKPLVSSIAKGDLVEVVSGPFKGEKAKVIRIDESKDKITVELVEAAVPIPITLDAAAVRVIRRSEEGEENA